MSPKSESKEFLQLEGAKPAQQELESGKELAPLLSTKGSSLTIAQQNCKRKWQLDLSLQ